MTKENNSSIHELSWNKTSFPDKLRLFFKSRKIEKKKIKSNNPMTRAEGYSNLSSTYYSIAGTAFFQLKAILKSRETILLTPFRVIVWGLTWLLLATWCYWRMIPLSNRVVTLIGYDEMSADQCDIRQSILRRRGRFVEAKNCIEYALRKTAVKAHTRGLLRVALADIFKKEEEFEKAKKEVKKAVTEAKKAEKRFPLQAARIYRNVAPFVDFLEIKFEKNFNGFEGKDFLKKAEDLARLAGAEDQLLKQQR